MKRFWKIALVVALGLAPATVWAGVRAADSCPCGSDCPCGSGCPCSHGLHRVAERSPDPLDRELARLADGDRSAFHSLYGALWPVVHAFCARALRGREDADDAAQEVMVKIFAEAPRYDRQRPAVAWALAIAAWECRTSLRRIYRRREDAITGAFELSSCEPGPEDQAMRTELVQAARAIIAELSRPDQQTLEASFLAEWDGRTASKSPSFRKRKERALARLRDAWRRAYGT